MPSTTALRQRDMDNNPEFQFNWEKGDNVPCDITWCRTTVLGDGKDAYVTDYSGGIKIFRYGPETDSWAFLTSEKSAMPNIMFGFGGLAGDLMLVGGKAADTSKASQVVSNWLCTECQPGDTYPPMLSPRIDPVAIGWGDYLIVAGGIVDSGTSQSVEVLDAKSKQWKPAGPLPVSTVLSGTVIDDCLYILGDKDKIYKASIQELTSSNAPKWTFAADAPFQHATLFSCNKYLLTAGGASQSNGHTVSDIMCFNETMMKWTKVGDLPQPCIECCCVYVPQCDRVFLMAGKETCSSSLLLKGVYRAFKPLLK